jgi:hypothetical protein
MEPNYFVEDHGIPFINWREAIPDLVDSTKAEKQSKYTALILEWLERLAEVVGSQSVTLESDEMIYFTYFEGDVALDRFAAIKKIRSGIIESFGSIYPEAYTGKNLIVELKNPQFFNRYVAHFYPEEDAAQEPQAIAQIDGCMCNDGYLQIALSDQAAKRLQAVVSHELARVFLEYYKLPVWLNEGIATNAEGIFSQGRLQYQDAIASGGHWHWDSDSFVEFLNDRLLIKPEAQYEFYDLAYAIVHNMLKDRVDFARLISEFKYFGNMDDAIQHVNGKDLLYYAPPKARNAITSSR